MPLCFLCVKDVLVYLHNCIQIIIFTVGKIATEVPVQPCYLVDLQSTTSN